MEMDCGINRQLQLSLAVIHMYAHAPAIKGRTQFLLIEDIKYSELLHYHGSCVVLDSILKPIRLRHHNERHHASFLSTS